MIIFIKCLIANSNTLHSGDGIVDIITTSTDIHAAVVKDGIKTDVSFNTVDIITDFNAASRLVVDHIKNMAGINNGS